MHASVTGGATDFVHCLLFEDNQGVPLPDSVAPVEGPVTVEDRGCPTQSFNQMLTYIRS